MMRVMLYEAAQVMLTRTTNCSTLNPEYGGLR